MRALGIVLGLLIAATLAAAGMSIAVIGNPELSGLVAERLGEDPAFECLERSQIDRVLEEQSLGAEGLLRAFPHLEWYVLLIASEPGGAGEAVVYNARDGFRVGRWSWPAGDPGENAVRIADEIRSRIDTAKRTGAIPVAIASVRDVAVAVSRRAAARQFAAWWETQLGNQPGIQLLERDRLELVTRERELSGTAYTLPAAAQLLHLEFSPGARADAVDMKVRLTDRDGRTLHEFARTDALADPAKTAAELAADLRAFWALPAPPPLPYDPAGEAARHADEARFLLTARDVGNALVRAQAAVALRPDVPDYRILALLCRNRLTRRGPALFEEWPGVIHDQAAEVRAILRQFPDAPDMTDAAFAGVLFDFLQLYPDRTRDNPELREACREAVRDYFAACREETSRPWPYREWRAGEPCRSLRQWQQYDMILMRTGLAGWGTASDPELMLELWLRDEKLSMAALAEAAAQDPTLAGLESLPDTNRLQRLFLLQQQEPEWHTMLTELATLYREHPVKAIRETGRLCALLAALENPTQLPAALAAYRAAGTPPGWVQPYLEDLWNYQPEWKNALAQAWPVTAGNKWETLLAAWPAASDPAVFAAEHQADWAALAGPYLLTRKILNAMNRIFYPLCHSAWDGDAASTKALAAIDAPYRWRELWRIPGREDRIMDAAMMPEGAGLWLLYESVAPDGSRLIYLATLAPDGTVTPFPGVPSVGNSQSSFSFGVYGRYAVWAPGPALYLWDLNTGGCTVLRDWPSPELRAPAIYDGKLYVWCGGRNEPKQLIRCALDGGNREILVSQLNEVKDHPWESLPPLEPEAWFPDPERGRMLLVANEGVWSFDPATLQVAHVFQCEVVNCIDHHSRRIGDEIQIADCWQNALAFDCRNDRVRSVLVLADENYDSGYPGECRLVCRGNTFEGPIWIDGPRVWTSLGGFDTSRGGEAQLLLLPWTFNGNGGSGRLYFPGPEPGWFYVVTGGAVFRIDRPAPEKP